MGKLEEFIQQHRAEFDEHEPSDQLWQKLATQLDAAPPKLTARPGGRQVPITRVWQMAAAFALLLMATVLLQYYWLRPASQQAGLPTNQLEQIAPELIEAEQFYTQQVQLKRAELLSAGAPGLGLDKDVDQELGRLDAAYQELKQDLYRTGNQEVVDRMIQNLQFRTDLLNRQLETLQRVRTLNRQKNGKQI
ncbi:MAG: hypothetical protein MUC97_16180 [Bernardetiaceae bacterium]|jgi:hypothetical protein|nr:hypothetical protein [Bernardetiaceae bacterium]